MSCLRGRIVVVLIIAVVGMTVRVSAQITPNRHRTFIGTVPLDVLSADSMAKFFSSSPATPKEAAIDAARVVFLHDGCGGRVTPAQAIDAARKAFVVDPGQYPGDIAEVRVPGEPGKVIRSLGETEVFCPEGDSDPPDVAVLIQARNSNPYHNCYPSVVRNISTSPSITPVYRSPGTGSQLFWRDNWEDPEYLGFLSWDGRDWAFAVLANGKSLIVFDLRGNLLLAQPTWGFRHLVKEDDDVVLYTILIDKAPASALNEMPGKDKLHKELALGSWRLWTLRRVSKGSNEVLASALVPAFRDRYDNNPEIEKRSAPLVKKARALFDRFSKEGRILDDTP